MNFKKNILSVAFFNRDTRLVARELLGKTLYHRTSEALYKATICETEAYHGIDDLACHCSKGKTNRTEVMFGEAGHLYIYLIYGMYEMLNFVTMPEGFPAAVLIRAVTDLKILRNNKFVSLDFPTDGPGKLTGRLQINRNYNARLLHPDTGIWVADEGISIPENKIIKAKRIGIDYAKEWKDKLWRFYYVPSVY
jgi:DNA-3-methyladenine glycosylase